MTPRHVAALLVAAALLAAVAWLLTRPWPSVRPHRPAPDFAAITDPGARKAAFLRWLAPIVVAENQRLARQRARLERVTAAGQPAPWQERWLATLAHHYRVPGDLDPAARLATLRRRLDTIPPRLVLAQAAIESGWGTSRFARQASNYFGIWTWRGDGLVPRERAEGAEHTVARYPDAAASVRVYLFTLNVGPAYRPLRERRAAARQAGRAPRAAELAAGLVGYSERREQYVAEIRQVLAANAELLDAALAGVVREGP